MKIFTKMFAEIRLDNDIDSVNKYVITLYIIQTVFQSIVAFKRFINTIECCILHIQIIKETVLHILEC